MWLSEPLGSGIGVLNASKGYEQQIWTEDWLMLVVILSRHDSGGAAAGLGAPERQDL